MISFGPAVFMFSQGVLALDGVEEPEQAWRQAILSPLPFHYRASTGQCPPVAARAAAFWVCLSDLLLSKVLYIGQYKCASARLAGTKQVRG